MIKEVIHDPIFLAGKSELATKEDLQVAQDLLDTLITNKDGCVGIPFAGNDAAVFDPETLEEIPYGQNLKGVLMIKTPTVMMGYFGESAHRNKEIFVKDQEDNIWISPEDACTMDENGIIQIIDRQKRGFNCLGMNVYPSVIESVLGKHEAVYESTVVGIPHPVLDKAPVANVVLKPEYRGQEDKIAEELEQIIKEEKSRNR